MLGNGNPKYGDKGSNFKYELSVLQLLEAISVAIPASSCCPTAATESTLLSVLAAIQAGQEYEQNLVIDQGGVGCPGNCPTYLQIRIWDTVNHVFLPPIYYDAAGNLVVPVGPLELVNPQFVLNNILAQVTAINADLDVTLSTRASEATLLITNTALGVINTSLSGLATQATLLTVKTVLDNIKLDTANLDVALSTRATESTLSTLDGRFVPTVKTPGFFRTSVAGTVAAGTRSVSVYNAGLVNGLWLGSVIKPGEQFSFEAGAQGDTLGAFAYDGTGTDLVITTTL
jgi:hypothetical protein